MLWALGNFSRFVRPGAKRVEATSSLGTDGLLVSSYLNANNELVTVIINSDNQDREVQLALGSGQKPGAAKAYETSAERDLASIPVNGSSGKFVVKGRSIVTVTGKI